jgi:hypothetical protein
MKRLRKLICRIFGHSFSPVDILIFKLECEGRVYTTNLLTGEVKHSAIEPQITCRCCKQVFRKRHPSA